MKRKPGIFRFKQFSIDQSADGFKVGTDGVLLGAWAELKQAEKVLDVGTGTGLIALMLAQRFSDVFIDAVEINSSSAFYAQKNFEASPWRSRLNLIEGDVNDCLEINEGALYHHIISNPPFFSAGTLPEIDHQKSARHQGSLHLNQLLKLSQKLLQPSGLLSLVLPIGEFERFQEMVRSTGFSESRICFVRTKKDKPVSRVLIELILDCEFLTNEQTNEIVMQLEQRNAYTPLYYEMVRDFYLKL